MNLRISFLVMITVIISCVGQPDPYQRINGQLQLDSSKPFIRDVHIVYSDSESYWWSITRERNWAQLPSIADGSKDFQLRIWEGSDTANQRNVYIFKYANGYWSGNDRNYEALRGTDTVAVVVKDIPLGIPHSGWNIFLNKLLDNDILLLKDETMIPGYRSLLEDGIMSVEISGKNYYKYSSLSGIYKQADSIKENKKMIKILNLIKNEF